MKQSPGKQSPGFGPVSPIRQRSNPITQPTFQPSPDTVLRMYEMGNPLGFSIVIVDLQKRVADAAFNTFPVPAQPAEVEVRQGKIEDMDDCDCVVISSNAFGLMNHGFDRSVAKMLGNDVCTRVIQSILDEFYGEQPVGTCILVPTGHDRIRYIAHAPTRRVNYSIRATDYVYLCVKACLHAIRRHNRDSPSQSIRRVVMTGLGTFYGAIPAEESARQMCLAWLLARMPQPRVSDMTWDFARERADMIGYGSFNNVLSELIQCDDIQMSSAYRTAIEQKFSFASNPPNGVGGSGVRTSPHLTGSSPRNGTPADNVDELSALPPAHRTDNVRDTVKVGSERVNKTTLQLPGRFKTRPESEGCGIM